MPKSIRLECDKCGGEFSFLKMNEDDNPERCELCGAPADDNVIELPPFINLKGWRTKSKDETYRNFEKSSEARIEMAAANTPGAQRSDFNHLKVTDMRSDVREGEFAFKPVQNEVTQRMDWMKSRGMASGFTNMGQVGVTAGGPTPEVAEKHSLLTQNHGMEMQKVAATNTLGKYTPK